MDVSIDRIRKNIEELCKFENRIAGTKKEREAADYLKGVLSEIGFDVKEHEFPVIAWEPKEATINLVSPEEKPIDCALFPNSSNFKQKVVLVDLESEQIEKEGKLPLFGFAEWGESLYTSPDTPYNKALDKGLEGLVIASPDEGELFKVRVGNRGKQLQIPIFSVSMETGNMLKKLIEENEVILDTRCVSKRGPSKSYNLEAVLEGSDPDFDIIVSAHYDAWFAGASDNAAPAAIVIEVARQMLAHLQQGGVLKRSIRFLLYGAEEVGSERFYFWLNGSRNYVESHDTLDQFALVINLDSIGYDATNYVGTTYELMKFAQSITSATKQEKRFSHYSPPAYGSDHWFFTIGGVPTIYLISWPSHLYHTQKDNPEHLDFESIHTYAEYIVHSLLEFSNADLLPVDVMTLVEFINERINGFSKIEGSPFELEEASVSSSQILENRAVLDRLVRETQASGKKEDIARLNDFLLKTARRLNRTIGPVSGEYEANYLSHLELIHAYVKIDSIIRSLEELPFMKIHPRSLGVLKELDDVPSKLVDMADSFIDLRMECNNLAGRINQEIENITSHLRVTLTELKELLD
ncbi:MAG: M28 family peptidase [Candidatus Thorarchaeota archaeon]|jgi:Zn-dependent M28 family amino/carboxypeptidase